LAGQRYPSRRAATALDDAPQRTVRGGRTTPAEPTDPYADEPRYPAWKVSLFVVLFCGAFWAGISYLAMRLLG
jgi:hypothetical protein